MAPSIANLFMGWLEARFLHSSPVHIDEDTWKRFIDDIFLLWRGTEEQLEAFYQHLNAFHPTIKFTMNVSKESVPFLDINIALKGRYLTTDIYTKPTDSHAYLLHKSCHPRHCIENIPYSQFLRLRRICSDTAVFDARADTMTEHFLARGYARGKVEEARTRVRSMARSDTLSYKPKTANTRSPFIVTHNPSNPPLQKWFAELQSSIIEPSKRMAQILPEPPVVGERNCKSLRSLLMPSRLPVVRDPSPGCFKCSKKCIICSEHLVEGNTFNSQMTGETFTIRDKVSCDTSSVVYLLYCDKHCPNSQYVGRTKNTLRQRFYVHRTYINKNSGTQKTHVTEHFNQPGHTLSNLKCLVIEKVYSQDIGDMERRESFWMKKLKTVFPNGLNTLD